jgi:hypothetical protein
MQEYAGRLGIYLNNMLLLDYSVIGAVFWHCFLKIQNRSLYRLPSLLIPNSHNLQHFADLIILPQSGIHTEG